MVEILDLTYKIARSCSKLNLENQTANFAASTLYTLSFYAKNLVGNGQEVLKALDIL